MTYLFASIPAQGSILFTIQPAVAFVGSVGDSLDLTLTNTGPTSVNIGGFSFGFSVPDPHIVFTGVTTATLAQYIFLGDSLFGPNIGTTSGAQTVVASDLCITCTGANIVGAGVTVGLGHIFFNVLPGATGVIPETFIAADNSLSTPAGANIAITLATASTITIVPSGVVPEPSTWAMLVTGLATAVIARKRLHRL